MNSLLKETFNDYKQLGLIVIPIEWDIENKQPVSHRLWSDPQSLTLTKKHNAMMIKTSGSYGAIDFDIKNTDRKTIFDEWLTVIKYQNEDLLRKLFIEKTRNDGYHVWLKYDKLSAKLSLADSDKGAEVIALYACGPAVYTYPTPGYTEIAGSMADIDFITDEEFEYLISTSQQFNEYKPTYDPNNKAVNYPAGFEKLLINFDTNLSDEYWNVLLNDIGLLRIEGYKYHAKDKFVAYRRKESTSNAISAKVYFKSKRVVIFSASMHDYPNWHNKHNYSVWSLPPSFLLFYKHNRDWHDAVKYIHAIMESIGMQNDFAPTTIDTFKGFPLHVFPDEIMKSILDVSSERSLAPEFVATAGLWVISSLAGTRYWSDFNGDARNILFCLMIAPVSVGKTPAFKVMCDQPLRYAYDMADRSYEEELQVWKEEQAQALTTKKQFTKKRPRPYVPFADDGTTESYVHTCMFQKNGIGVYQDEAETIFNAGNFKGTNDAISFFTQAFSGGRVTQLRADDTKTRIVADMNMNLLMGTQPARLKNIFTEDRLSSGFASRFIMVESGYLELNINSDPFSAKKEMCTQWNQLVGYLYTKGLEYNNNTCDKCYIAMSDAAKNLYRHYHKENLIEANTRIKNKAENYIIGTEAKMSAYFPRLVQILSILHNATSPVITEDIVHKGWQLYKFYASETIRVISGLHGEIETGLPKELDLLYEALPNEFERKDAAEICERININKRRFDVSMRRKDFSALFTRLEQGKYRKR